MSGDEFSAVASATKQSNTMAMRKLWIASSPSTTFAMKSILHHAMNKNIAS